MSKENKLKMFPLLSMIVTTLCVGVSITTLIGIYNNTAYAQLYMGRGVIIHYHIYGIPPPGASVLSTAYGPQYHVWYRTHVDLVFHSTPWIQFPVGAVLSGTPMRACVTSFNYGAQSCGFGSINYGTADVYIKMR